MSDPGTIYIIVGIVIIVGVLLLIRYTSKDRYRSAEWTFDNGPWQYDQVREEGRPPETPSQIRQDVRTDAQNPVLGFASAHRYLVPSTYRDPIYPAPSAGPLGGPSPLKRLYSEPLKKMSTPREIPFFSSVDESLVLGPPGLPELFSSFRKVGLLSLNERDTSCSPKGDTLMELYQRPISPLQDIWEYYAQDKNGFMIPLKHRDLLEDDDLIPHITGKGGPWKVHLYSPNRYIRM